MASGPPPYPPVVRSLARRLLARVDVLADELVAAILEEDAPLYAERGPATLEDLRLACTDGIRLVLHLLAGGVPASTHPLDAAAVAGRRQAQQDLPLEGTLRAYRLAGRIVWTHLVTAARAARPGIDGDRLLDGATAVWEVIDELCGAAGSAYRSEESVLRHRDVRLQGAILDALIDGRGSDPGFARDAARSLGIPLTGGKVCVLAPAEGRTGEVLPGVKESLAGQGIASAWQLRPAFEVGVLALGSARLGRLRRVLESCATGRTGISPVFDDLADLPVAFHLADLAARTAPAGQPRVSALEENLAAALLVDSPAVAEQVWRRTVGPLEALSPDEREVLVATLRAYLRHDGSASAAAAELFCHRNTVAYRLGRIEALTGLGSHGLADKVLWTLGLVALDLRTTDSLATPAPAGRTTPPP